MLLDSARTLLSEFGLFLEDVAQLLLAVARLLGCLLSSSYIVLQTAHSALSSFPFLSEVFAGIQQILPLNIGFHT